MHLPIVSCTWLVYNKLVVGLKWLIQATFILIEHSPELYKISSDFPTFLPIQHECRFFKNTYSLALGPLSGKTCVILNFGSCNLKKKKDYLRKDRSNKGENSSYILLVLLLLPAAFSDSLQFAWHCVKFFICF